MGDRERENSLRSVVFTDGPAFLFVCVTFARHDLMKKKPLNSLARETPFYSVFLKENEINILIMFSFMIHVNRPSYGQLSKHD